MSTITEQIIDEIKALGLRCIVFGPEVWLAIIVVYIFSAGIVVDMWLVALQMLVQQRLILLQYSRPNRYQVRINYGLIIQHL